MINELALNAFKGIETPFYYYDMDLLRQTIDEYTTNCDLYGFKGHYALKANSEPRIVKEMVRAGLGADCVSGNEVKFAIKQGFKPESIVFAGVGKSDKEIREALEIGIYSFNCESIQELEIIDEIAGTMGKRARVALRINPNVDAHTHKYITTGVRQNKFGIYETEFPIAFETLRNTKNVDFIGLHFHVGSQVTDMNVFKLLCGKVLKIQKIFNDNGFEVDNLNLGGGLGVNYDDPKNDSIAPFKEYFQAIHDNLPLREGQKVHFESGRPLVAQCGHLVSRVLFTKQADGINFIILDAGMNDLIRPALYSAHHLIENLESKKSNKIYDVVGPVCESSDTWGKNVSLPETQRGELFAIHSAGAYGQVMAMTYNMKPLAKAYYSNNFDNQ